MKIAFVGRGGSGKTTVASVLVRHLVPLGRPVLALDAGINHHLAVALGAGEAEARAIRGLGQELPRIKDYLRGANPRISSGLAMTKTTPPAPVRAWFGWSRTTRSTTRACTRSGAHGWR